MNKVPIPDDSQYRAIVEHQPDFVCRFLPDGTITFVNEAYCRFFGVRREDIIGRPYTPVVYQDDMATVTAQIATLSPDKPVVLIENRVLRGDGQLRWTQWTNRALYDEAGQLVELQSAGRDITELKQAQEDAAQLAAIVASAESAILSITLAGTIASWNRAAEQMFGYSATEAIGRPHRIIVPADRVAESEEILTRISRGETVRHGETERMARDGRRLPVSLTISPIRDVTGRITGVSEIMRDIGDRKRIERELVERESRFRLMADHAPVLIWMSDTGNKGTYFNTPWLDFTGVPIEKQLGDGWLQLIHPDDAERAGAYCQRHFDERLPFTMEFRLRHHSGEYRWVEDKGRPLFLPDGTFRGYIGSCLDIHERKLVDAVREATMRRESDARAAAEEAGRAKDEFLAVISHELRTPLNAILGWARMVREGTVPPEALPKALETIERNARIQAQLVDDLLDVSRFASGRLALRTTRVDVAHVVHAAVDVVRPAAANKAIDLRVDVGDTEEAITGDAGRLQQAVWNLLTNAVKFTPAGGRIDVHVRRTGADVTISVRDTGVGIPADLLPIIFDRFQQADSRPSRAHGGLGLGLTLVAYVAEAHGGSVQAWSAGPGRGATFTVTLPAARAASASGMTPAPLRPARRDLRGCRVLVVDDEADARDIVRHVLERCGATVQTVESVHEALGALQAGRPDVLIADIGIPVHDGYELIRLVRSSPETRALPALALTAYASTEDERKARNAGYDAFLAKPVDLDALSTAVARLCGVDAAEGENSSAVS